MEVCTIDPHDCLQKEAIHDIKQHVNSQIEFRKEIFNGYQEHEIKAVIEFLISIGRVFSFFKRYKVFAFVSILLILSAITGVGIADVIVFLKAKGIWCPQ